MTTSAYVLLVGSVISFLFEFSFIFVFELSITNLTFFCFSTVILLVFPEEFHLHKYQKTIKQWTARSIVHHHKKFQTTSCNYHIHRKSNRFLVFLPPFSGLTTTSFLINRHPKRHQYSTIVYKNN
jgi:hypothetical protein